MIVIAVKLAIAVGFTTLILIVTYLRRRLWRRDFLHSTWVILLFIVLFRLIPYAGIYGLAGLDAQSDVVSYFWPQAVHASQGEIVYRDFDSHYAPLFPYVLSVAPRLWHDPRSIVLLMTLVEAGTLVLTFLVFRRYMDAADCSYAALLYLMSPAPLILVLLGGQEDVWLWLFGALIAWLLLRREPLRAGLIAGIGLLATKALFLVAVIPTFFAVRRHLRYLSGVALAGVLAFPPLLFLAGSKLFMPLREGTNVSPPNLWFVANAFTRNGLPFDNPWLSGVSLALVLVLGVIFFSTHRGVVEDSLVGYAAGWVFTFSALMLFSPKSLGNYVAIFLMPLTFLVVFHADKRAMFLTLSLNILASVQPSLWYRLGSPAHVGFSFLRSLPQTVEFLMELAMLAIFVALMVRSWQWVTAPAQMPTPARRLAQST